MQGGYGGPPQGCAPQQPPGGYVRGIPLALGTVAASVMTEELGMNLAMAAAGPPGFGIIATLLTKKTSTGGAGKLLCLGCLAGFILSTLVTVFFTSSFPTL